MRKLEDGQCWETQSPPGGQQLWHKCQDSQAFVSGSAAGVGGLGALGLVTAGSIALGSKMLKSHSPVGSVARAARSAMQGNQRPVIVPVNMDDAQRHAIQQEIRSLELQRNDIQQEISTLESRHESYLKELRSKAEAHVREWHDSAIAVAKTESATQIDGIRRETHDEIDRLKQSHERAKAETVATLSKQLETVKGRYVAACKAIQADLKKRKNQLADITARYQEIKGRLISEAREQIDIARAQFSNEQQAAINELQREKLQTEEWLSRSKMQIVDEIRPVIEGPLIAEIQHLQTQVAKLQSKLAKAGKSTEITLEQIKQLLTHDWDGVLGPIHLRIAGQSGSGKSHLVNQIISGGMASLGVQAVFTVLDPYGSDTQWAQVPTVTDDPEAAAEIVRQWGDEAKGEKLSKPHILVIDEADTLIKDHDLKDAVKSLVKMGRHRNRFLILLGQNGNCLPGFQWSDIRNMAQIYLSEVATDYVENGLKGRNKSTYLGELEALSEQTPFYAIVKNQGMGKAFTCTIPKILFPVVAGEVLVCPKCQSTNTKKAGLLKGRQRLYCHACKKQSYADQGENND